MNSVAVVGVVLILFNNPCSRSSENDWATGIIMKRLLRAYNPGTRNSNTLCPVSSIITDPNASPNITVSAIGSISVKNNVVGTLIKLLNC
ncbi:unnamed protein product, partial [marine sediment metagenome]